jgi:hypothetical protein
MPRRRGAKNYSSSGSIGSVLVIVSASASDDRVLESPSRKRVIGYFHCKAVIGRCTGTCGDNQAHACSGAFSVDLLQLICPLRKFNFLSVFLFDFFPDFFPAASVATRVARWYVFKPKIQIWVKFGGSCNGRCGYILWTFGPFHRLLLNFMDIWYSLL